MIVNLAGISLAGKGSGYSQRVDLSSLDSYRAIRGEENRRGWLLLQNRSGSGLEIDLSGGRSFRILDGQDQRIHLKPEDEAYTLVVIYVLSNPSLTTLFGTFFSEDDAQDLAQGASTSIGLAGVSVSQVINDGNSAPAVVLEATPSGGSSSAKINNDGSGFLSGGVMTFDAAGNLNIGGKIVGIGGQASAGSFGAAVLVAQASVQVQATGSTTILTYTPSAPAWYRVTIVAEIVGTAGAHTITAGLGFTSQFTGQAISYNFAARTGGSTITNLNGASITSPTELTTFSETIHSGALIAINVSWNNATATVNDTVTAFIERLA